MNFVHSEYNIPILQSQAITRRIPVLPPLLASLSERPSAHGGPPTSPVQGEMRLRAASGRGSEAAISAAVGKMEQANARSFFRAPQGGGCHPPISREEDDGGVALRPSRRRTPPPCPPCLKGGAPVRTLGRGDIPRISPFSGNKTRAASSDKWCLSGPCARRTCALSRGPTLPGSPLEPAPHFRCCQYVQILLSSHNLLCS